jgi:hypothetical protein
LNLPGGRKCDCAFWGSLVAIVGAFLIVGALVWAMRHYTAPAPLGEDRADFRRKALADTRNAEQEALNNYGWQDQTRGVVRIPIEEAMKLAEAKWGSDPGAARTNLISREEKAIAPLPKAPPKPSAFE